MNIFTQEQINDVVSVDIIISVIFLVIIVIYGGYKLIDYLWFCHKLNKNSKKEKSILD